MSDVARAVGVSRQVVSAVLGKGKGAAKFSEATAQRVRAVARELGYRPHRSSQGLLRRRHHAIGLLLHSVFSLDANAHNGLLVEAAARDLVLITECIPEHDGMPIMLREQTVDGIIVLETLPAHIEAAIGHYRIPAVYLNTNRARGSGVITFNEMQGMRDACAHLAARGWRRPVLLSSGGEHYSHALRASAFADCARSYRWPTPTAIDFPFSAGGRRPQYHRAAADALLACLRQYDADALIAQPEICMDAYRLARRQGWRIGHDLAVVATRDSGLVREADPPLTSLSLPHTAIGRAAVATLFDVIAGKRRSRQVFDYVLVEREST